MRVDCSEGSNTLSCEHERRRFAGVTTSGPEVTEERADQMAGDIPFDTQRSNGMIDR